MTQLKYVIEDNILKNSSPNYRGKTITLSSPYLSNSDNRFHCVDYLQSRS